MKCFLCSVVIMTVSFDRQDTFCLMCIAYLGSSVILTNTVTYNTVDWHWLVQLLHHYRLLQLHRCTLSPLGAARRYAAPSMNYHQDGSRSWVPSASPPSDHKALIATVLLLLALTFSLSDVSSSLLKRILWRNFVSLVPSRLIYILDRAGRRYKWLPNTEQQFKVENFGDQTAKAQAIQRIFRSKDNTVVGAISRVRALSGLVNMSSDAQAGLHNINNSCFQNSVLQSLASLPTFKEYLIKSTEENNALTEAPTQNALKVFLGKMSDGFGAIWVPEILTAMSIWEQQDAQEYFSKILDAVDEEASMVQSLLRASAGLEAPTRSRASMFVCRVPSGNPFEGLQVQRVACTRCGYVEGFPLQPFNCLTISMGRNPGLHYVENLLDNHTALEEIEGVECTKCSLLHHQMQLKRLMEKLDSERDTLPEEAHESQDPPAATSELPEAPNERLLSLDDLRLEVATRLTPISKAIEEDRFSEPGLLKKCGIRSKNAVSSTKTKQVAIARPPKNLVIHINRSIFDQNGHQMKDHSPVRFPAILDLSRWCLGAGPETNHGGPQEWSTEPRESLLSSPRDSPATMLFELRAAISHHGRHEHGHYTAFGKRKIQSSDSDIDKLPIEDQWYYFNDESVIPVGVEDVLQGDQVFMLFYSALERSHTVEEVLPQQVSSAALSESPIVPTSASSSTIDNEERHEPAEALDEIPLLRALPERESKPADIPSSRSTPAETPASKDPPLMSPPVTMRTGGGSAVQRKRKHSFAQNNPAVVPRI